MLSDSGDGKYTYAANKRDNKQLTGKLRKNSTTHSSAVRTAMLEIENSVASSKDALRTASAAYGSPINIPQTATVQPLPQLQQSYQTDMGKVTRTSVSSPSPSSSTSSSAPTRKLQIYLEC